MTSTRRNWTTTWRPAPGKRESRAHAPWSGRGTRRGLWGALGCLLLASTLALAPWGSTSVFAALGPYDTATGSGALSQENGGDNNTADGVYALRSNTTGQNNTASGTFALQDNTTGQSNTAAGFEALFSNTTADNDTAFGTSSLHNTTTGSDNTAYGAAALYSNTMGTNNTASGWDALSSNTTGSNNTASGAYALYSNTTGILNSASGPNALYRNTTGDNNTASGSDALSSNTTGSHNTASGSDALSSNTTGSNNTASGSGALYSNTTGAGNTASGPGALAANTTGNDNTSLGYYAGDTNSSFGNTTGSNNTFLGAQTGPATNNELTNATAIGWNARVGESNALVLGGTGADAVKVGIGTATPASALTVVGTIESTSGGIKFPDGSMQTTASTFAVPPGAMGTFLRSTGTGWTSGALVAGDLPAGSTQYLQSTTTQQAGANFNVAGNGALGGTLTVAGKVGIGTATPGSSLTVAGTIESTSGGIKFPDGSIQATASTFAVSPGAAGSFLRSTGTSWTSGVLVAADLPAGSTKYLQNTTTQQADANFNIAGNGVLGGTLTVAGKVGVGTAAPNSLLQVGTASTQYGTYLQLPLVTSKHTPPAAQCNSTTLVGRIVMQYNPKSKAATLRVCSSAGRWVVVH